VSDGTVDVNQLAQFLNLTPRRVQQLVAGEGLPVEARGKYDLLRCSAWYVRYLQRIIEARGPNGRVGDVGDAIQSEKLKQAQMESETMALRLARDRQQVVEVEVAGRVWDESVSRTRARMLAAVGSEAGKMVGLTSVPEAHRALEDVVYKALSAMVSVADDVERTGEQRSSRRTRRTGAPRASVAPRGSPAPPPS
jgi:plasmid maintenance system antidote protein VapI